MKAEAKMQFEGEVSKPLGIAGGRICDCPNNHLNCMTAKDWIKAQIGVWEFTYEKRDIRDKNIHPAVFPISMAMKVISLFTHRGELVVDPFVGSGTTLVAAKDMSRNAVGFDINEEYIRVARRRLSESLTLDETHQLAIRADARDIADYFREESVSLLFTSPPYSNLLDRPRLNKSRRGTARQNGQYLKVEQYSQEPNDLGTLGVKDYQEVMKSIYTSILPILKPRGRNVINVPDFWVSDKKPGHRVPLHIHVYDAMKDAGYELRNTIIWNRRNIVNRVGIFGWPSNYITMGTTFEYILDFWKPG